MWNKLKGILDDKLIRHFRESHAPVSSLSLGTAVGLFWALTPLVGIQMMLTTATWVVFKSFKIKFNLPISLAWVWLTNPFTMPFFYYAFYMAGHLLFQIFDPETMRISFDLFKSTLAQANEMNLMDGVMHWVRFIAHDLGWPMIVGATLIGLPSAIISYPLTFRFINNHRRHVAENHNMTLEEWENRYVYKTHQEHTPEPVKNEKKTAERPVIQRAS